MRNKPHDDAQTEKIKLKAQLMIGFAIYEIDRPWDGQLYHRLHRAQDALANHPATAEVVLVHYTGTLYYQSCGEAIGRVLAAGGVTQHIPVQRHQRRQRGQLRVQAAAAKRRQEREAEVSSRTATRHGRGFSHQAYID